MVKDLLRDSVIYTIATVLSRGIQIILLPIYTRYLSPSDYGMTDLLGAVSALATVLVSVELLQAIARFYPMEKDQGRKKEISSTGLFFVAHNYLAFALAATVLAPFISRLMFGSGEAAGLVRIAAWAMAGNGIYYYLQAQLRWDLRSVDYSIASIVYVTVSALASIVMIIFLRMRAYGLFGGQIAGALVAGGVSFYRNRPVYGLKYSTAKLREMLSFSLPFVLSSLCVILSTYVDRFFIKRFCQLELVGVYGTAVRLSSVVSLVFMGFNIALTPMIYSNAESPELPNRLARLFAAFISISSVIAAAAFLFSPEIVGILFSREYAEAASVAPILVCSAIGASLYLFFPGMSIRKQTRPIVFIGAIALAANFAFNALLVPFFGIFGAAASSLGTSMVTALSYFVLSQKKYPIPFRLSPVLISMLVILAGAAVAWWIDWVRTPALTGIIAKTLVLIIITLVSLGKREYRETIASLLFRKKVVHKENG